MDDKEHQKPCTCSPADAAQGWHDGGCAKTLIGAELFPVRRVEAEVINPVNGETIF